MPDISGQKAPSPIDFGSLKFAMKGSVGSSPHHSSMAIENSTGNEGKIADFTHLPIELSDPTGRVLAGDVGNFVKTQSLDTLIHVNDAYSLDLKEAMRLIQPAILKEGESAFTMDNVTSLESAKSGLGQFTTSEQGLVQSLVDRTPGG